MSGATIGLIGGIVGAAIGIAGGVVGTWASLRSSPSPEARAVVVRFSIAIWSCAAVFFAVMVLAIAGVIPLWVWWIVFTVSMVALGPAIMLANRRMSAAERRPASGGGLAGSSGGDPAPADSPPGRAAG